MPKPIISEDLIVVDPELDASTAESVITILSERLAEKGYVDESYCQAALDRERRFPTGLPTLPYATAIPHADDNGARHTGVAVAILSSPVPFRAMDTPDRILDVRIVMLMAVAESANQVSMLQWVCTLVQDQALVKALASAKSSKEVMTILKPLIEQSQ